MLWVGVKWTALPSVTSSWGPTGNAIDCGGLRPLSLLRQTANTAARHTATAATAAFGELQSWS